MDCHDTSHRLKPVFCKAQFLDLFLVYVNGLLKDLNSNVKLFADHTSLFLVAPDPRVKIESLNEDLSKVSQWVL